MEEKKRDEYVRSGTRFRALLNDAFHKVQQVSSRQLLDDRHNDGRDGDDGLDSRGGGDHEHDVNGNANANTNTNEGKRKRKHSRAMHGKSSLRSRRRISDGKNISGSSSTSSEDNDDDSSSDDEGHDRGHDVDEDEDVHEDDYYARSRNESTSSLAREKFAEVMQLKQVRYVMYGMF